jgi:hypothetical protein
MLLAFERPHLIAAALVVLAVLWVGLLAPPGLRRRGACAAGLGALASLLAAAGSAGAAWVSPGLLLALWLAGAVLAGSVLLGDRSPGTHAALWIWPPAVAGLCVWSMASLLWVATVSAGGV